MSVLITEPILAEQARQESSLARMLDVVAAWAGLPVGEGAPRPGIESDVARDTRPDIEHPGLNADRHEGTVTAGQIPQDSAGRPQIIAAKVGKPSNRPAPDQRRAPSLQAASPMPSTAPGFRGNDIPNTNVGQVPHADETPDLRFTAGADLRPAVGPASAMLHPNPDIGSTAAETTQVRAPIARATLRRGSRAEPKRRRSMIDPGQPAATGRPPLPEPERMAVLETVGFEPSRISAPARSLSETGIGAAQFDQEQVASLPRAVVSRPGHASPGQRLDRPVRTGASTEPLSAPVTRQIDPFRDSTLEEQIADALERAALEAGIDLT